MSWMLKRMLWRLKLQMAFLRAKLRAVQSEGEGLAAQVRRGIRGAFAFEGLQSVARGLA